jgi:polysaccharide deacetylase 2 family uncharacterized protein YibQ
MKFLEKIKNKFKKSPAQTEQAADAEVSKQENSSENIEGKVEQSLPATEAKPQENAPAESSKKPEKQKKEKAPKQPKQKTFFFAKNELKILLAINLIFLIIFGVGVSYLSSVFESEADKLFDQGRKVVIDVATSTISYQEPQDAAEAAEEKPAEEAKTDEAAKPVEEKKPEEVKPVEVEAPKDYTKSRLAVVISNMGMRQDVMDMAKTLPKEVTFSFSPYSPDLQTKIDIAKADGRQVLLGIEMEASSYPLTDGGALSIQSHLDKAENLFRLQTALSSAKGYIGVNAPFDEVLTHNLENITPILTNLKSNALFFTFYVQPANNYLEKEVKPLALDIAPISYYVDVNPSRSEILKSLEVVKKEINDYPDRKIIIAIQPYPVSINTLNEWINKNSKDEKLQIAPISYFVIDN